jgi:hypothetical protein
MNRFLNPWMNHKQRKNIMKNLKSDLTIVQKPESNRGFQGSIDMWAENYGASSDHAAEWNPVPHEVAIEAGTKGHHACDAYLKCSAELERLGMRMLCGHLTNWEPLYIPMED